MLKHKRLVALWVATLVGSLAPVQQVGATNFSFAASMASAAQARHVPLALIEAIAYVNTRWEVIGKPARDGGFLPMDIKPSQVDMAASFSGQSAELVKSDPAVNLDAGAALLAHYHTNGSDLASWKPAVVALLGYYVTIQVFEALRGGESTTTSTGESITLVPPAVGAPAPAPAPGSPAAVGGAAAPTAPAAVPDYPAATWVPASSDNYSTADRPHDYPVDMIVIHDIEGSYGSAIQEFQNGATQASAHYVVSDLGQITQMVLEKDVAWHAGNWDYNTRAIGIEHEGYASGPNWYTPAMYDASAHLAASICSRWGVPMDRAHVIGHYQVPDPNNPGQFGGAGHHTDPGVNWDWAYYMNQAVNFANALPSPPHMMPDPSASTGDHSAVVTWSPARSCHAPITGYTVTARPGNIVQTLPASATRATFAGLQNGVLYTFTITATDADGTDSMATKPVLTGPMPFGGLYTLDGWGGVHENSSPRLQATAYWPNWSIARSIKTVPVTSGPPLTGFVLDGVGGLHSFGGALTETNTDAGHRWGWDIARDFAFLPDGTGGLVLDGYGGLHPFRVNGNKSPLTVTPSARWGVDIARKLVIFPDASGGYVLDGFGGLHPFGINGAVPVAVASVSSGGAYWPDWDIARDIVLVPGNGGHSGYMLDGFGGIHPFKADGSLMPAPIKSDRFDWDAARTIWLSRGSTAAAPAGYYLDGYGGLHGLGAVPIPDHSYWDGWDIAVGLAGQ